MGMLTDEDKDSVRHLLVGGDLPEEGGSYVISQGDLRTLIDMAAILRIFADEPHVQPSKPVLGDSSDKIKKILGRAYRLEDTEVRDA